MAVKGTGISRISRFLVQTSGWWLRGHRLAHRSNPSHVSGCSPVGLGAEDVKALRGGPKPTFTDKYGSPTWLDIWGNDEREVVYVHGDVRWGGRDLG
jgi:hypothetical protein